MIKDLVLNPSSGQALPQIDLGGLRAYGCIIDNITNQWLYEVQRRRFIPPYQSGATIPLPGVVSDSILLQAPGQIAQATPNPGEYAFISFTDEPQIAGLGVNVGSFTAPPPVVVTDLQQGNKPAAPAAGVTRLWADLTGKLHGELATGADAQFAAFDRLVTDVPFGAAMSTTSSLFVASADSIAYTPQANADLVLLYYGTFQNTLAGPNNSLELTVDGVAIGYSVSFHSPGAAYNVTISIPIVYPNATGVSHTIAMYWATNGGTLQQGNNRHLSILELRK